MDHSFSNRGIVQTSKQKQIKNIGPGIYGAFLMGVNKMTVAYIGEYHSTNGTYYRQRITVNQAEYNKINTALSNRYTRTAQNIKTSGIMTYSQMETMCYEKPLEISDRKENKIYLKLNQLYFIMGLFPDQKRITDNNTILYIRG